MPFRPGCGGWSSSGVGTGAELLRAGRACPTLLQPSPVWALFSLLCFVCLFLIFMCAHFVGAARPASARGVIWVVGFVTVLCGSIRGFSVGPGFGALLRALWDVVQR